MDIHPQCPSGRVGGDSHLVKPATMAGFIGGYTHDLVRVLVASVLAEQHVIVLGAPGWGKTAICQGVARQITGESSPGNQWVFSRLDPSTPPEVLKGVYDPAGILQGNLRRVLDGTPYAPGVLIAILDEIFRANDAVFDVCLDVLDRQNVCPGQTPVVWGTANFTAQGERIQALLDRFGLWLWLPTEVLDAGAIARAHLESGLDEVRLSLPVPVPSAQEVKEVRTAQPGPNATKAVSDFVAFISQEAQAQGLRPNPRRIVQWTKILFRLGTFFSGSADFSTLPQEAIRAIRWAWPAPTPEEGATWAQIAAVAVDPIQAQIDAVLDQVQETIRRFATAGVAEQAQLIAEAGRAIALAQQNLIQNLGLDFNDPRLQEAIGTMNRWLQDAIRGSGQPGR